MGELVHLRLEATTRKEMARIVKREQFGSESEFIRDAIRKNIEQYHRLEALRALRGSASPQKGKLPPTSDDVFRTFGLRD